MMRIKTIPRSDFLLIAATAVAALRMMLINAAFIGFDLTAWSWFGPVEVASGVAFALLEGVALAYISRRWRKIEPIDRAEWAYWLVLLAGMIYLLLSIVFVTAYAATAARLGVGIDDLLGPTWAIIWSASVAGINPIIVLLIGIVEDTDSDVLPDVAPPFAASAVRKAQAGALLNQWQQSHGLKTPRVSWLKGEFESVVGGQLTAAEADEAVISWRAANGVSGRRPGENGNG